VAARGSREVRIERRPASGGGSCARCRASLGLASLKVGELWYCSSACAEGPGAASPRVARVPEPWLYARPQRFFHKRMPKELRSTRSGS
jgi:hypothetical protein